MMDKKDVADLLEQTEPQANDHNLSISDATHAVKPEVHSLAGLRASKGLLAKDMVEVVRSIYPKYDKMLHSKCEHGDEYGIDLRKDAMDALVARYDPDRQKSRTADRHRHRNRITARLPDGVYRRLQQALRSDGLSTQKWIEEQVHKYLQLKGAIINDQTAQ